MKTCPKCRYTLHAIRMKDLYVCLNCGLQVTGPEAVARERREELA